jgi:hypothetical protein
MKMRNSLYVLLFGALFFAPSLTLADAVLSVSTPATVSQGNSFMADVNISGVTDLYDFQFDLGFNPSVLQVTGVSEGTFLTSGGTTFFLPGVIDNTSGSITFNADTLEGAIPGVTGAGTLLVFDFTAIGPGTSTLSILNNADLILQDSTGANINATTTNGSVTVQGTTTVPEPSVLMLLSAGLLALAGLALKRAIS